jgi:hypothetical protein
MTLGIRAEENTHKAAMTPRDFMSHALENNLGLEVSRPGQQLTRTT